MGEQSALLGHSWDFIFASFSMAGLFALAGLAGLAGLAKINTR